MLHLIYGSSISKMDEMLMDYMIQEASANPDVNYTLLVPEQMGLSAQDMLVKRHPEHALFNMDVLTFNRLSYHVFDEMNDPKKNMIDDAGKQMLLRLCLTRVKKDLHLLKNNMNRPGFLNELKSLMSELVQYNIRPETLERELESMTDQPQLREKIRDILIIYQSFLEELHQNYEMAEERLQHLSALLPGYEKAKKTVFFMTGFTGFTPPQYDVIAKLLQMCPSLYLNIPVGSELLEIIRKGDLKESDVKETDLFYMPIFMAEEMKKLAISSFAPEKGYDEMVVTEEYVKTEEIIHLERNLYRNKIVPFEKETNHIQIYQTRNRKTEVQAVLSMILSDIRKGYLFSDLAVITGSVETYRDEIEDQFKKAGVPFFMDSSKSISKNPLFQLIRDVMEVQRLNFSFDETLSYMKNPLMMKWLSDYLSLEEDELSPYERVAELENYVRATGVRGISMYEKQWTRTSRKTAKSRLIYIEETKNAMIEPLLRVLLVLSDQKEKVSEKLKALVYFLEELEARETLLLLSEEMDRGNNAFLKAEYQRSYELLMELFEDIAEILGDEVLPFEEFEDVLTAGMQGLKINIVPPTRNRLVVGDLMRTRLGNIKKLYIIGANEEVLLKSPRDGGLLSDLDREYLKEKEIQLSETARQEIFNRRFYLYLLLSKPAEEIKLFYSSASMDGKSLSKAALLEAVKKLFPKVLKESVNERDLALISTVSQAKEHLSTELRLEKERMDEAAFSDDENTACVSSEANALYHFSSEANKELTEKVLSSACYHYKEPTISKETALRMYGDVVSGSISRLEGFSSCAYRHFLSYGLGLSEAEEYRLSEADYGTIFHDSIEGFFRTVQEKHEKWDELSEETLERYVDESVEKTAMQASNEILKDNARNSYLILRVKRLTLRTLRTLKYQWNQGQYEKTEVEKRFEGGKYLPELSFMLEQGRILNLQGRIDRVDTKTEDDRIYVKIMDYKSGDRTLDYTKIYYGIQLQLLVYMEAARAMLKNRFPEKEIIPGGVYYYHIDDPVISMDRKSDVEKEIRNKLCMKGLTNMDAESLTYLDEDFITLDEKNSSVVQSLKKTRDEKDLKKATLVYQDELKDLGTFALQKTKSLTESMLSGEIGIHPYAYQKASGCDYCPYQGICHFDHRMPGFKENRLQEKTLRDFTGGDASGVDSGSEESH